MPKMNKPELTQETFDKLLSWLDPNREQSGRKYETIRRGLVKVFTHWGCVEADELADETINRVAGKVESLEKTYSGNPSNFFYGVAKKVRLEHIRRRSKVVSLPADTAAVLPTPDPSDELTHECLDHCIQQLAPARREMIWHYFQEGSGAKHREALAKRLGVKLSTLRVKIFRTILVLEPCVKNCVERGGVGRN